MTRLGLMTLYIGYLSVISLQTYFCVIPARGGSKRIPKKNIQEVAGIPLIGHVIKNAIASNVFQGVYVSTDSDEISSVALELGAEVLDRRPSNLSDDYTPTRPVIADFIERHPKLNTDKSVIACVYPFAILIDSNLIRLARDNFEALEDQSKYLAAIQKYPHPIQRAFSLSAEGVLSPSSPASLEVRTQDLPARYHDAGQFYFAKSSTWLSNRSVLANAYGFLIPKYSAVDIDDMEDLEYLRSLYK
jgi:pseudaminic acid cytidylyltransferase